MIAATTAGRVPLCGPGPENTLSPTTSCVETTLSHASRTESFPVKFVIPLLTISTTLASRAWKASVAPGSSTTTTRARGPFVSVADENKSPPLAEQTASSQIAHHMALRAERGHRLL